MFSKEGRKQFAELVEQSKPQRERVRKLVNQGRWREAEPNPERLRRFTERKVNKAVPQGAESFIGPSVDLQAVNFLAEGALIRSAIAYVEVNTPHAQEVGSGFLISPRLFLTCQHVIADAAAARGTQITFGREMDESNRPRPTTTYLLDPDTFALFSDQLELDYAIIAVGRLNSGSDVVGTLGSCPLLNIPDSHVIGMGVNIIQHPRGWPKMIAIRNNILTYRTDKTLLYETDTEQGSSGAPVFNDEWEVVALHHWGEPFLRTVDEGGREIKTNVNEGVRISAIYADLRARIDSLPPAQREMLEEALTKADAAAPVTGGKVLKPPPLLTNPVGPEHLIVETKETKKGFEMGHQSDGNEIRITVPLEITVRLGTQAASGPIIVEKAAAEGPPAPAAKALTRGAEALKIDKNYDNRRGYEADFIPGYDLSLPTPNATLAKQVAPLRAGEDAANEGELKYQHFSIKMHKTRRMALFTATNIDGETYLTVDRDTGRVAGAEGETWYKDPRISEAFFIDQTFYSGWSHYFDRGHLTRRTDPTWGSEEEAERANADTYHFTNCSPQHFRFNQTTRFWQGVERYVLEKGVLAADSQKRLCVYQGPIFDDKLDHRADDVQIPSSFYKVVVWKGADGLKAVGLIVDQLPLLGETRKSLGQPKDGPPPDVSQWRVAIAQIEKRTGLTFADPIRDADTIDKSEQPAVGAESARPIRSFEDILS